jgi:hypothetical protein
MKACANMEKQIAIAADAAPGYAFCLFENTEHLATIGLRHS